jgi:hypothetical protein
MPQPSKSQAIASFGPQQRNARLAAVPEVVVRPRSDLAALDCGGGEALSVLAAHGRGKRVADLADYRMLRCGKHIENTSATREIVRSTCLQLYKKGNVNFLTRLCAAYATLWETLSMAIKKHKTHRRRRKSKAAAAMPMRKTSRRTKRARKSSARKKTARRAHKARRGARRSMKRR